MVCLSDRVMLAKLKRLPPRTLETLERYVTHRDAVQRIADDERVGVTAIYERLMEAERQLGVPIQRNSRRGRPRKAAARRTSHRHG